MMLNERELIIAPIVQESVQHNARVSQVEGLALECGQPCQV